MATLPEVEVNAATKTPETWKELFQSNETLWYNNGRWGSAGYAIANCAGKTWTVNNVIFELVNKIGRQHIELMHRDDVKFTQPPRATFLWDLYKALKVGRFILAANQFSEGDEPRVEPIHTRNAPTTFLVYPVPHFGERLRQRDLAQYSALILKMLADIMQHTDNERQDYVTAAFSTMVSKYINEIVFQMGIKYLGMTREELEGSNYEIPDEKFSPTNYQPDQNYMPVEMSEERQPPLWWPTANDLSAIRGIPVTDAMMFAARWPRNISAAEGDWETTLPGLQPGSEIDPGAAGGSAATTSTTGRPLT